MLAAERFLEQIQALGRDHELTPLGQHLSLMPCSPQVGRLLVFGALLGCVNPASSAAAACLMAKGPFATPAPADKDLQRRIETAKVRRSDPMCHN